MQVRDKQEKNMYQHTGMMENYTHYVQVLLKIIDVYKFHGHLGNVFSGNGHMETPFRETAARTTSRWHVTAILRNKISFLYVNPGLRSGIFQSD